MKNNNEDEGGLVVHRDGPVKTAPTDADYAKAFPGKRDLIHEERKALKSVGPRDLYLLKREGRAYP